MALSRIAVGVLVGEHRALRGQLRRTRIVLGGDQLDALFLAPVLGADGVPQRGVVAGDALRVGEHDSKSLNGREFYHATPHPFLIQAPWPPRFIAFRLKASPRFPHRRERKAKPAPPAPTSR